VGRFMEKQMEPRNTRTTRNQNGLEPMTDSPNGERLCPLSAFSFRVFDVVCGSNCGFQIILSPTEAERKTAIIDRAFKGEL
jgi:hypothetical protein